VQRQYLKRKQAFTLIELSIVLVIIGLILSGILVGRDLIRAAQLRKVIRTVEEYNTAVMVFQGKYNCLPGDCKDATVKGVGSSAYYGGNGNGDSILFSDHDGWGEIGSFFYHLSQAKLIAWVPPADENDADIMTQAPRLPIGSNENGHLAAIIPISVLDGGYYDSDMVLPRPRYWWLGADFGGLTYTGSGGVAVYTPLEAFGIDVKIDDGLPLTGNVLATNDLQGALYGPYFPSESAAGTDACVSTSSTPKPYNMRNNNRVAANMCGLVITTPF
jgi:prepilin-type N-terminal cleavage/methylation domain-containing protein